MSALWERQYGESRQAYAAFCRYRDMGESRSVDGAYCQAKGYPLGTKQAPGSWKDWSRRWEWVERALAWDDEQDRIKRDAQLAAIARMAERHAALAASVTAKVHERLKTIAADKLTPRELIEWLEVATRIEREARGLPTMSLDVRQRGKVDVGIDLSKLTDAELTTLEQLSRRARSDRD